MPTLSIKNVPDAVVERLRRRAALNHRSMQGELMALITHAVATDVSGQPPSTVSAGGATRIEDIGREHQVRWPEPFAEAPRAVDLIRSDRDAR